jgi:hypothetical protein
MKNKNLDMRMSIAVFCVGFMNILMIINIIFDTNLLKNIFVWIIIIIISSFFGIILEKKFSYKYNFRLAIISTTLASSFLILLIIYTGLPDWKINKVLYILLGIGYVISIAIILKFFYNNTYHDEEKNED